MLWVSGGVITQKGASSKCNVMSWIVFEDRKKTVEKLVIYVKSIV